MGLIRRLRRNWEPRISLWWMTWTCVMTSVSGVSFQRRFLMKSVPEKCADYSKYTVIRRILRLFLLRLNW